jgi:predicted dehydrogenase
MRLAFVGFRHVHVMMLYHAALKHPSVQVVAACEEDAATAEQLRKEGHVKLTHSDYARMLAEVPCDAIGVGDCYRNSGGLILSALRAGKHVISDKPICIRRDELDPIAALTREKSLKLGCLLDLRGAGDILTVRRLIHDRTIGEVHTVAFSAQHPLLYGVRPHWYFEPGMHGGTINDIGVHAFDIIPWITGRKLVEVVAARAWNARLPQCPQFQDAAQLMLRMDNGGGVVGDVSYLAPDGAGYVAPQYWRMTFHGSDGVIECAGEKNPITFARNSDKSIQAVKAEAPIHDAALNAFLNDLAGKEASPSTRDVLEASRIALAVQAAANQNRAHVAL